MSKFIKRLRKKIKSPTYVLCFYSAVEEIDDMIENFPNILCFNFKDRSRRKRNVIYIDDRKQLLSINTIDLIFIDDQQKENLTDFKTLLENRRPIIFLGKDSDVSRDDVIFFQKFRFTYIETMGRYSIWKHLQ